jgi:hypothetical protein
MSLEKKMKWLNTMQGLIETRRYYDIDATEYFEFLKKQIRIYCPQYRIIHVASRRVVK